MHGDRFVAGSHVRNTLRSRTLRRDVLSTHFPVIAGQSTPYVKIEEPRSMTMTRSCRTLAARAESDDLMTSEVKLCALDCKSRKMVPPGR